MLPSHMSGGFGLIMQKSITFSRRNSKVQWQKWQPEYLGAWVSIPPLAGQPSKLHFLLFIVSCPLLGSGY